MNKKVVLLISSVLMLPFTFGLFQVTTLWLGPKWGYVSGFVGYWAYCLLTVWLVSSGGLNRIKPLWNQQSESASAKWISFVAFIPVAGVFFVSFLPNAAQLTVSTGVLLVIVAVLNGSIEELYWRGLYLLEYRDNTLIGFVFSWFLFGAWHVSLWFANGVVYTDGVIALIGGAYGLGLLWTWVARKNGNLRAVIPAHILTNLFAFTALFVSNGF
jgi:membrane protease YdiL (CAAX protease family)